MARTSKEKDSTYNRAYYERLKQDPERLRQRAVQKAQCAARRQYNKRVEEWEVAIAIIKGLHILGMSDRNIAETMARGKKITRPKKNKWIDFSPLSEKSLSSSSLPSARPAHTQEPEAQA